MQRLYFVRHGQSQANVDQVYAGVAETPLTELGRQQARIAGQAAKDLSIDCIVSSPLERAYDTAAIIAQAIGYAADDIRVNPLLVERNYGVLVGKPWEFTLDLDSIDGVESVESIAARGRAGYDFLRSLDYQSILVVSHGTYYQALVMAIDPAATLIEGNEPANARIVRLL